MSHRLTNQSLMVVITRNVSGVCVLQKPTRLVIQEPDIVVGELGFKNGHIEVVEELCLHVEGSAASRLPPTEITHSPQVGQAELEEFTVDFLLAAHDICRSIRRAFR